MIQQIKSYVDKKFGVFGATRRQEISRLLFEISKREKIAPETILQELPNASVGAIHELPLRFDDIKNYLVRRRFPTITAAEKPKNIHTLLTDVNINPNHRFELNNHHKIIPKNIFIEESVAETDLAKRLPQKLPQANFQTIARYRDYIRGKRYGTQAYNERTDNFFIVRENYDFFKRCPCSCKSVSCGYHVFNLGQGCAFECTYCYLQDYINSPGIVLPANIEDFFTAFADYKQDIRVGTGEMTDSLIFDHLMEYSVAIVDFFNNYPKSTFEFKTKSDNVKLLLTTKPKADNIIVGWSVNPQAVVESVEFYTASIEQRLMAAEKCVATGFKIAFHFDPIIYFQGWEKHYEPLVNEIFDRIDAKRIAWISLGTLRISPRLKKIVEGRFPENTILDEEMILGYDEKLRYHQKVRTDIYQKMTSWIRSRGPDVQHYLCMEEKEVCGDCGTLAIQKF